VSKAAFLSGKCRSGVFASPLFASLHEERRVSAGIR